MTAAERLQHLDPALKGLVKLIKAVRYYPPGHPSLSAAITGAQQDFAPLLQNGEPLTCIIRKEGFFCDDKPVAPGNPILTKLAQFLFARRLQQLLVLPDLSGKDLVAFARCLTLETTEIQKMGGIHKLLQKSRVSTLWVNEVDLESVLARKQALEAHPSFAAAAPAPVPVSEGMKPSTSAALPLHERNLEIVLQELREERSDQRFRLLLQELIPQLRLNLNETRLRLILEALFLLGEHASAQQPSLLRREHAQAALDQLASDDVLDFLIAALCTKGLKLETRGQLIYILSSFRAAVIRRLMDHLAEESDSLARKYLTEAIVNYGYRAIAVLIPYLNDPRWYVVRNAIIILGDIRNQDTIGHLVPLLQEDDLRVRRETIRAITKIGGQKAVNILIRVVDDGDPELRRQAILSLGAIRNSTAVPALLRLLAQPSALIKNPEVAKDAITALGKIGSDEAAPLLSHILKRRKFWARTAFDEIRATAALALGKLGTPEATLALEAATEERSPEVARAAALALKQVKKSDEHGPGSQ